MLAQNTATGALQLSMYSQSGQLMYEYDEPTTRKENVYLNGSLVGTRELPLAGGTNLRYKHTDSLGSVVATTNESGAMVGAYVVYDPYGKTSAAVAGSIGYTGHHMDATGLTYMQQRYYDPSVGSFLSADPVSANNATGWNFNRYNYAANNPYRFTDPDGRMVQNRWRDALGQNPFGHRDPNCQSAACRVALGGPERRYANGKRKKTGSSSSGVSATEAFEHYKKWVRERRCASTSTTSTLARSA